MLVGGANTIRAAAVAHWTFEEGSGTMAGDSVGGHSGTLTGNANWAPGRTGTYALNLDGSGDYVNVPSSSDLNITGDVTIAGWVYFRKGGNGSSSSAQGIVTKTVGSGAYNSPYDFRTGEGTLPALTIVRADASGHEYAYGSQSLSLNTWYHVAVVVNNNSASFYVNGNLSGKSLDNLNSPATGNSNPLLIGARANGLYLDGMIDDVWLFNNALSASEIQQLVPEPATLLLLLLGVPVLRKK